MDTDVSVTCSQKPVIHVFSQMIYSKHACMFSRYILIISFQLRTGLLTGSNNLWRLPSVRFLLNTDVRYSPSWLSGTVFVAMPLLSCCLLFLKCYVYPVLTDSKTKTKIEQKTVDTYSTLKRKTVEMRVANLVSCLSTK
jgi:hypothetical protein